MAQVALSPEAQGDSDAIIADLARTAGLVVAQAYAAEFDAAYDLLADHPEIGPSRPKLGLGIRIKVVTPYILIYRYDGAEASATVLRIVHDRRRITRSLLP